MRQISLSAFLCSMLMLAACTKSHENHEAATDSYYTCPMHPSVVSSTPGACPICNMTLIKVQKKAKDSSGKQGNYVPIDRRKQELAGIRTDTVRMQHVLSDATILGSVSIDEELVTTISSRVKGRIDKLFVTTTGGTLKNGSPLYSIYSEQLRADETDYLTLLDRTTAVTSTSKLATELLRASKQRLRLWGLSEKQIAELKVSGTASPMTTFYSPEAGYVSEVNITEGSYVEEGTPLIKITSLRQVWVEAQIYANELSGIRESKKYQVSTEREPEELYSGTLVYNNPVVEEGKRIYLLRIRVDNTKGKLIPGMLVSVHPMRAAQYVLAVPKSAVLLEEMKTVWIASNQNTFEQRMVETGIENKQWIEIVSGLAKGEVVVTEGAYLVSSEFILKSGAGQRHAH